ncbi:MAG: hypothetical protein WC711_01350 [Candidatus Staskawiczbacteria bacterium]
MKRRHWYALFTWHWIKRKRVEIIRKFLAVNDGAAKRYCRRLQKNGLVPGQDFALYARRRLPVTKFKEGRGYLIWDGVYGC